MKPRFFFAKRAKKLLPVLITLLLSVPLLIAASCNVGGGGNDPLSNGDIKGGVTSSSFGGVTQLKMLDAHVGWAATGASILKTSNGGQHWTDVTPSDWVTDEATPTNQTASPKIAAAFFQDANNAWIVSSNTDEVGNSLAATAAASDGTETPKVDAQMQIYVRATIDGGHSWMDAHPITVKNLSEIYPPFFINQHEGWLAVSTTSDDGQYHTGLVYRSIDGGITWQPSGPISNPFGFLTGQATEQNGDNVAGLTMTPNCITTLSTTTGLSTSCGQGDPNSAVQGCTSKASTDTIGWVGYARTGSLLVNETTDSGALWSPVYWPTPGGAPGQTKDSIIVSSPPTIYGDGTGIMPIQMQSGPDSDDPSNFYLHLYKMTYKSGTGASETSLSQTSPFASQIDAAYHIVSAPDVNHVFALGQVLTQGQTGPGSSTSLYEFTGGNWQALTSTVNSTDTTAPHPDLTTLNNSNSLANLDFISDTEGWSTGGNGLYHITINGNNATWDQVFPPANATTDAVTHTPGQVIPAPANPPSCDNPNGNGNGGGGTSNTTAPAGNFPLNRLNSLPTDTHTWYGPPDNDPPGYDSYPHAKGTGTYADPITFAIADNSTTFHQGEEIYIPEMEKYFFAEDTCAACAAEHSQGKQDHIDLWAGDGGTVACETSIIVPKTIYSSAADPEPIHYLVVTANDTADQNYTVNTQPITSWCTNH